MDGFFYCDKMSFQCKVGDRLDKAAVGSRMCRPPFLRADRVRSNHGVWTLVDGEHILFRQGKVTCYAGEIVFQKQVKIGIKSISSTSDTDQKGLPFCVKMSVCDRQMQGRRTGIAENR